jgi:hypothetical protein
VVYKQIARASDAKYGEAVKKKEAYQFLYRYVSDLYVDMTSVILSEDTFQGFICVLGITYLLSSVKPS